MVSLAGACQSCLSFQEINFWFYVFSFVYGSLVITQNLWISWYLLLLVLVCPCFSELLRGTIRSYIFNSYDFFLLKLDLTMKSWLVWNLLHRPGKPQIHRFICLGLLNSGNKEVLRFFFKKVKLFIAIKFPPRTAPMVFQKFWYIVLSYPFSWRTLIFPYWIQWSLSLGVHYSISKYLCTFWGFFAIHFKFYSNMKSYSIILYNELFLFSHWLRLALWYELWYISDKSFLVWEEKYKFCVC